MTFDIKELLCESLDRKVQFIFSFAKKNMLKYFKKCSQKSLKKISFPKS